MAQEKHAAMTVGFHCCLSSNETIVLPSVEHEMHDFVAQEGKKSSFQLQLLPKEESTSSADSCTTEKLLECTSSPAHLHICATTTTTTTATVSTMTKSEENENDAVQSQQPHQQHEVPFIMGGFEIISNARNLEIYVTDDTPEAKDTYLTTCRGIKYQEKKDHASTPTTTSTTITTTIESSPQVWYKALLVIPGGPKSMMRLRFKLLSLQPSGNTICQIRSIVLKGRLPTPEQVLQLHEAIAATGTTANNTNGTTNAAKQQQQQQQASSSFSSSDISAAMMTVTVLLQSFQNTLSSEFQSSLQPIVASTQSMQQLLVMQSQSIQQLQLQNAQLQHYVMTQQGIQQTMMQQYQKEQTEMKELLQTIQQQLQQGQSRDHGMLHVDKCHDDYGLNQDDDELPTLPPAATAPTDTTMSIREVLKHDTPPCKSPRIQSTRSPNEDDENDDENEPLENIDLSLSSSPSASDSTTVVVNDHFGDAMNSKSENDNTPPCRSRENSIEQQQGDPIVENQELSETTVMTTTMAVTDNIDQEETSEKCLLPNDLVIEAPITSQQPVNQLMEEAKDECDDKSTDSTPPCRPRDVVLEDSIHGEHHIIQNQATTMVHQESETEPSQILSVPVDNESHIDNKDNDNLPPCRSRDNSHINDNITIASNITTTTITGNMIQEEEEKLQEEEDDSPPSRQYSAADLLDFIEDTSLRNLPPSRSQHDELQQQQAHEHQYDEFQDEKKQDNHHDGEGNLEPPDKSGSENNTETKEEGSEEAKDNMDDLIQF